MSYRKYTQFEQRLEKRIERLEAEKEVFYREMVQRGEDISAMIRIFLYVRNRLPFGPEKKLEEIAKRYALRNDKDRGSVCKCNYGQIDVRDEGIRGVAKVRRERAAVKGKR